MSFNSSNFISQYIYKNYNDKNESNLIGYGPYNIFRIYFYTFSFNYILNIIS